MRFGFDFGVREVQRGIVRSLLFIAHDFPGMQFDHAFAHGVDDLFVVRGHHDGGAGTVDGVQHLHDAQRRSRVEIAGRLVGKQDLRMVHIGARDGYTLGLTAGKLMRIAVLLTGQTDSSTFGTSDLMVDRLVPITSNAKATFSHTVLLFSSL